MIKLDSINYIFNFFYIKKMLYIKDLYYLIKGEKVNRVISLMPNKKKMN